MRPTLRNVTAGLALVTITLTGCTDATDVSGEPTSPRSTPPSPTTPPRRRTTTWA